MLVHINNWQMSRFRFIVQLVCVETRPMWIC